MKVVEDHIITDVKELAPGHILLRAQRNSNLPLIQPGNFAEIEIPGTKEVFLRRPFTFLDVDPANRIISFYIKTIGKGTRVLAGLKVGESLNILYPLGNAFTIPDRGSKVLMAGGGSGIAPFPYLGRVLNENGVECHFAIGGKTLTDIHFTDEMQRYGQVFTATEDGSSGIHGLVTASAPFQSGKKYDLVYVCGPDGMMKAVGRWAAERNIPCEVSLENTMACGFGVCLCCVTPTTTGNRCVCTDGPVFKYNEIVWPV